MCFGSMCFVIIVAFPKIPTMAGGLFACVHDLHSFNGLRSGCLEIHGVQNSGTVIATGLWNKHQGNKFSNPSDVDCISLIGNNAWCCPEAVSNNELQFHLVCTGNCDNTAATNFAFDCKGAMVPYRSETTSFLKDIGACKNIQEPHQETVLFSMRQKTPPNCQHRTQQRGYGLKQIHPLLQTSSPMWLTPSHQRGTQPQTMHLWHSWESCASSAGGPYHNEQLRLGSLRAGGTWKLE